MMLVVLYSENISILKRWYELLRDEDASLHISKSKEELVSYLDAKHEELVLVLENKINDEESEAFLELISSRYPLAKIVALGYELELRTAIRLLSLGVKAYGNAFMQGVHLQEAVKSVWEGKFWFYPKFLDAFSGKSKEKTSHTIGKIEQIQNLALARIDEEENILSIGEELYEDELVLAPYIDSYVKIHLDAVGFLEIENESKILLDESVFSLDSFGKRSVFDAKKCEEILLDNGRSQSSNKLDLPFVIEEVVKKPKVQEGHQEEEQEEVVAGIEASYSGKIDEYEIYFSKNLEGFIVIKDKVAHRDGSDLISQSISKCIFLDTQKTYKQLVELCG